MAKGIGSFVFTSLPFLGFHDVQHRGHEVQFVKAESLLMEDRVLALMQLVQRGENSYERSFFWFTFLSLFVQRHK